MQNQKDQQNFKQEEEQINQAELNLDIDKLQQLYKQGLQCIKLKFQKVVIVLGNTGSGKSTLINLLTGKKLQPQFIQGQGWLIKLADGQKGAEIGSSFVSQTSIPEIVIGEQDGIAYVDCPGFSDNKGAEQDITNSVLIQYIFQNAEQIKMLFVVQKQSFDQNNDRGNSLIKFVQLISQMIIDVEVVQKSIALIVTKVKDEENEEGEKVQVTVDNIVAVLNKMKNDHQQNNKSENFKQENPFTKAYSYLRRKENIGIFRAPQNKNDQLNNNQDLIKIIQNLQYIHLPNINMPLSAESKNKINLFFKSQSIASQKIGKDLFNDTRNYMKKIDESNFINFYEIVNFLYELKNNPDFSFPNASQLISDNNEYSLLNQYEQNYLEFLKQLNLFQHQNQQEKESLIKVTQSLLFITKINPGVGNLTLYSLPFIDEIFKISSEKLLELQNLIGIQIQNSFDKVNQILSNHLKTFNFKQVKQLELIKQQLQNQQKQQKMDYSYGEYWLKFIQDAFQLNDLQEICNSQNKFLESYQQFLGIDPNQSQQKPQTMIDCYSKGIQRFNLDLQNQIDKFYFEEKEEELKNNLLLSEQEKEQQKNEFLEQQRQQNKKLKAQNSNAIENYLETQQNIKMNSIHDTKEDQIIIQCIHFSLSSLIGKNIKKPFVIFATNKIKIDGDLKIESGILILVAPEIVCTTNCYLDLSGKNQPNGTNGKDESWYDTSSEIKKKGYAGQSGESGGHGGQIYIYAKKCVNFENLTINVSGGNGGNGGDGGNGGSCNESFVFAPTYRNGGDGGNGGDAGKGGFEGKCDVKSDKCPIKNSKGKDGIPGNGGNGGKPWFGQVWSSGSYGNNGMQGGFQSQQPIQKNKFNSLQKIKSEYQEFLSMNPILGQLNEFNNGLQQGEDYYINITGLIGQSSQYDFF